MLQTLEYIEAYFENTLNPEQRLQFEQRCVTDEAFAKEVAFYITGRKAARLALEEDKKKHWKNTEYESGKEGAEKSQPKIIQLKRWLPYAAAASLIISIAVYFLFIKSNPQQLASHYINDQLTQIGQTMGASADSLQQGIEAYNQKEYDRALQIFESISRREPQNSDVIKYKGLSYLMKKDYSMALLQFDALSAMNLYSNGGLFLKAVTLLERNQKGDKEKAKQILQQVVAEKKEGSAEAQRWLDKW